MLQCGRHFCPKATGFRCLMRQDLKVNSARWSGFFLLKMKNKLQQQQQEEEEEEQQQQQQQTKMRNVAIIRWICLFKLKGFFTAPHSTILKGTQTINTNEIKDNIRGRFVISDFPWMLFCCLVFEKFQPAVTLLNETNLHHLGWFK